MPEGVVPTAITSELDTVEMKFLLTALLSIAGSQWPGTGLHDRGVVDATILVMCSVADATVDLHVATSRFLRIYCSTSSYAHLFTILH